MVIIQTLKLIIRSRLPFASTACSTIMQSVLDLHIGLNSVILYMLKQILA